MTVPKLTGGKKSSSLKLRIIYGYYIVAVEVCEDFIPAMRVEVVSIFRTEFLKSW